MLYYKLRLYRQLIVVLVKHGTISLFQLPPAEHSRLSRLFQMLRNCAGFWRLLIQFYVSLLFHLVYKLNNCIIYLVCTAVFALSL
jgi:hypothetical protein